MKHLTLCFLLNGCLLFASCKEEAADPISQLPPATQTGAETFGCLVNGEAWTPKGRVGVLSNLTEDYNNGTFNVSVFRSVNGKRQSMGIFVADTLTQPGIYPLNDYENQAGTFADEITLCSYDNDGITEHSGSLKISKLDIPNRIITGTFEVTLTRPDCDTIRVTEGRFDLSL